MEKINQFNDQARLPFDGGPSCIKSCADQCLALLKPSLDRQGIQVKVDIDPKITFCLSKGRLERRAV